MWQSVFRFVLPIVFIFFGIGNEFLFNGKVLGETFNSITIDGQISDWPQDTHFDGSDGSKWFFTWNETHFFFGVQASQVAASLHNIEVLLFIDTWPTTDRFSGKGSNTLTIPSSPTTVQQTFNIPFNAKYYLRWTTDNFQRTVYYWNKIANTWAEDNSVLPVLQFNQSINFLEVALRKDSMPLFGAFYGAYVCGAMIDISNKDPKVFNVIPASNHTSGRNQNFSFNEFYGFTLTSGVKPSFVGHLDSYTTSTTSDGDFDQSFIWLRGIVPDEQTLAYVGERVTVELGTNARLKGLVTVQNVGTFYVKEGATVTFFDGSTIMNNGEMQIEGSFIFNGTVKIVTANPITFKDLTVQTGQVDFGQNTHIGAHLYMNGGLGVGSKGPIYASETQLVYNGGSSQARGSEWNAAAEGAGYPSTVIVTANTVLHWGYLTAAAGVATELRIDVGSVLSMDAVATPLIVNGVLNNLGTIIISSQDGGNLMIIGTPNLGNLKCTGKATAFVNGLKFNKPTIMPRGDTDVEIGTKATLAVVSPISTSTYTWMPVNVNGDVFQTGVAGSYYVQVTDQNGCKAESDPIEIKVHAPPTTGIPTTAIPTTAVPTTAIPTTAIPTTAIPTTAIPTTAIPTTAIPTTAVPTTAIPTTAIPTTAVPTTAIPTTGIATTGAAISNDSPKGPNWTTIRSVIISVGAFVGLAIIVVVVVFVLRKKKKEKEEERELLLAVF